MEDAIDKRNLKDQIARSIIKRQFVNYITVEEAERIRRLKEEQEGREKKSETPKSQRHKDLEAGYNRKTGAYSGKYGQSGEINEVTKSQIEQILGEKDEVLRHVIEKNEHP